MKTTEPNQALQTISCSVTVAAEPLCVPPHEMSDLKRSAKIELQIMKQRLDDEELQVALPPEEFDNRIRQLLGEAEAREISPICERIVYWRSDIPASPKAPNMILWILGYIVAIGIFLYGLFSIGVKLAGML